MTDDPSKEQILRLQEEILTRNINSLVYGIPFELPRAEDFLRTSRLTIPKDIRQFIHEVPASLNFDSIIGNSEAKQALRSALFPEAPEVLKAYGRKLPKGVLFYGPPGTGKTMLAKAAASGQQVAIINASELQTKYIGETESFIRQIFDYGRHYYKHHGKQLILFLDEADAMLPPRDRAHYFQITTVSTFLAEMDGLKENNLFIIMASNRPGDIDEAILRPGRIDRRIEILRPSIPEAVKMFDLYMKDVPRLESMSALVDAFQDALGTIITQDIASNGTVARRYTIRLVDKLSGALVAGIVEQIKDEAITRDSKMRTVSGVCARDVKTACEKLAKETPITREDLLAAIEAAPDIAVSDTPASRQ